MDELVERLNEAWRKLYGDGDEHGVCDTFWVNVAEIVSIVPEAGQEVGEMARGCQK